MEKVSCSSCGSNVLTRDGSYYVCSYCGTRFKTNNVDSTIALNDDVASLIQKCKVEPQNARRYANLILDIDPNNKEALQYLK